MTETGLLHTGFLLGFPDNEIRVLSSECNVLKTVSASSVTFVSSLGERFIMAASSSPPLITIFDVNDPEPNRPLAHLVVPPMAESDASPSADLTITHISSPSPHFICAGLSDGRLCIWTWKYVWRATATVPEGKDQSRAAEVVSASFSKNIGDGEGDYVVGITGSSALLYVLFHLGSVISIDFSREEGEQGRDSDSQRRNEVRLECVSGRTTCLVWDEVAGRLFGATDDGEVWLRDPREGTVRCVGKFGEGTTSVACLVGDNEFKKIYCGLTGGAGVWSLDLLREGEGTTEGLCPVTRIGTCSPDEESEEDVGLIFACNEYLVAVAGQWFCGYGKEEEGAGLVFRHQLPVRPSRILGGGLLDMRLQTLSVASRIVGADAQSLVVLRGDCSSDPSSEALSRVSLSEFDDGVDPATVGQVVSLRDFSPYHVAFTWEDGIYLIDVASGEVPLQQPLQILDEDGDPTRLFCVRQICRKGKDGSIWIAAGSTESQIVLWNVEDEIRLGKMFDEPLEQALTEIALQGTTNGHVSCLEFHEDSDSLFSVVLNERLQKWNVATGKMIVDVEQALVNRVSLDTAGQCLYATGGTSLVQRDLNLAEMATFDLSESLDLVMSLLMRPHVRKLLLFGPRGEILSMDLETREFTSVLGKGPLLCSVASKGTEFVTVSEGGEVAVWQDAVRPYVVLKTSIAGFFSACIAGPDESVRKVLFSRKFQVKAPTPVPAYEEEEEEEGEPFPEPDEEEGDFELPFELPTLLGPVFPDPETNVLVCARTDSVLQLVNAETGDVVGDCALSSAARDVKLIFGSYFGVAEGARVSIWDANTMERVGLFENSSGKLITSLAFLPPGRIAASTFDDVQLFSVQDALASVDGKNVKSETLTPPRDTIVGLEFVNDKLIARCGDGIVWWGRGVDDDGFVAHVAGPELPIEMMAVDGKGGQLFCVAESRLFRFDLETMEQDFEIELLSPVQSLMWNPITKSLLLFLPGGVVADLAGETLSNVEVPDELSPKVLCRLGGLIAIVNSDLRMSLWSHHANRRFQQKWISDPMPSFPIGLCYVGRKIGLESHVVVSSVDNVLRFLRSDNHTVVFRMETDLGNALKLVSAGPHRLVMMEDMRFEVWDLMANKMIGEVDHECYFEDDVDDEDDIMSLICAAPPHFVVTGTIGNVIRVWDLRIALGNHRGDLDDDVMVNDPIRHSCPLRSLVWFGSRNMVFGGDAEGSVFAIDVDVCELKFSSNVWPGTALGIVALAHNCDDLLFAAAVRQVAVLDASNLGVIRTLPCDGLIQNLYYCQDAGTLHCCLEGGRVSVFRVRSGDLSLQYTIDSPLQTLTAVGTRHYVTASGTKIALMTVDGTRVWDTDLHEDIVDFCPMDYDESVHSRLTPLAASPPRGSLEIQESAPSPAPVRTSPSLDPVHSAVMPAEVVRYDIDLLGKNVVVCGGDGPEIFTLDVSGGEIVNRRMVVDSPVEFAVFNNSKIGYCAPDNLAIWNPRRCVVEHEWSPGHAEVSSLTQTSGILACGCLNGEIRLWDVVRLPQGFKRSGWLRRRPEIGSGSAIQVVDSPSDRDVLVSCSEDVNLQIWDLSKMRCLLDKPLDHRSSITSLVLGGATIMTSSLDGTIRVWENNMSLRPVDLRLEAPGAEPIVKMLYYPSSSRVLGFLENGNIACWDLRNPLRPADEIVCGGNDRVTDVCALDDDDSFVVSSGSAVSCWRGVSSGPRPQMTWKVDLPSPMHCLAHLKVKLDRDYAAYDRSPLFLDEVGYLAYAVEEDLRRIDLPSMKAVSLALTELGGGGDDEDEEARSRLAAVGNNMALYGLGTKLHLIAMDKMESCWVMDLADNGGMDAEGEGEEDEDDEEDLGITFMISCPKTQDAVILSGLESSKIDVLDCSDRKIRKKATFTDPEAMDGAVATAGGILWTISEEGTLKGRSLETGEVVRKLETPGGLVNWVVGYDSRRSLVLAAGDVNIYAWDVSSGTSSSAKDPMRTWTVPAPVRSLLVMNDYFVVGLNVGSIQAFDLDVMRDEPRFAVQVAHTSFVDLLLRVGEDFFVSASVGKDQLLKIWAGSKLLGSSRIEGTLSSLAFAHLPDESLVALPEIDQEALIADLGTYVSASVHHVAPPPMIEEEEPILEDIVPGVPSPSAAGELLPFRMRSSGGPSADQPDEGSRVAPPVEPEPPLPAVATAEEVPPAEAAADMGSRDRLEGLIAAEKEKTRGLEQKNRELQQEIARLNAAVRDTASAAEREKAKLRTEFQAKNVECRAKDEQIAQLRRQLEQEKRERTKEVADLRAEIGQSRPPTSVPVPVPSLPLESMDDIQLLQHAVHTAQNERNQLRRDVDALRGTLDGFARRMAGVGQAWVDDV